MNISFRYLSAALAISASLLAGCGGGGGGAAVPPGTGADGVTAMGGSLLTAAGVAIDGIDAGFYGLPTPAPMMISMGFESPQASSAGRHPTPTCSTGSVVTSTTGENTHIRYNNCVIESSTLNGTITVEGPPTYELNGTWTSTYAGFTVNTTDDAGAPVRLAYSGSQVFKDLVWTGSGQAAEATAGNINLKDVVVDINSGAGNMSFNNLVIDFAVESGETGITVVGGFGYTLKLADFGIPVPAGAPSTVVVNFTASTPEKMYFTETTDRGRLVLDSSPAYKLELNFTTDKAIFTTGGVATEYPME